MNKTSALVLSIIAVAACSQSYPEPSAPVAPPTRRADPTKAAHHGPLAPLDLSWVSVQMSATHAVLRARIDRRSPTLPPLTLSVTVPPDVRIERGATPVALPATQQTVTEHEFEFSYARIPDGDIQLTVGGTTDAMGVHSQAWFRFGRPEPRGPRPEPSGPPLIIGGRNFGSPVRAASSPAQ